MDGELIEWNNPIDEWPHYHRARPHRSGLAGSVLMTPPFIVVDSDDRSVSLHSTLESAATMVEPWDLSRNDVAFYDSEAHRFRAEEIQAGWGPFKVPRVRLTLEDADRTYEVELRQALVDFLTVLEVPVTILERATLRELIDLLALLTRRR
jgi:hypothetical protein